MLRILVLGATGFVGSHLVGRLLHGGYSLRLGSRDKSKLQRLAWQRAELVEADVLKPETLPAALEQIDVVYFLVHGMAEGSDFHYRELMGAHHLAQAAERAGVKRIIYLGAVCPPQAQSQHLASRTQTGDALRRGAVPVIELRAPVIIGPGSAAFEVMRDLVANLPMMITPRWVRSKMAPIALDDLLFYLEALADAEDCDGQIFNATGLDTLSYQEQMQVLARLLGRSIPIIPVPLLSPSLSSHWLRFITAVPEGVARALIGGLKQDLLVDSSALRRRFPHPLTGFEAAVQSALAQEQSDLVAQDPSIAALLKRRWRSNYSFYPKTERAEIEIGAPVEQVWAQLLQIGAAPRYFAFDPLWRIRELLDAMVGGEGLNYYRRDPYHLQVGDRIDSWRVAECDENRRLTLHFGMKAPGMGGLTFALTPHMGMTKLALECWWYPAGASGLLYWWAMLPAHGILFQRMGENIRKLSLA